MKELVKLAIHVVATIAVLPLLLLYLLARTLLGRDRAFQYAMQWLAIVPGLPGLWMRRAFLCLTIDACDRTVTVEFGTLFSRTKARLAREVYIGAQCHLGWVDIGEGTLLASGVHVPSGPYTDGIADPSKPIREQPGSLKPVRIGANCWIGSAAIVLADVGDNSVVAAGSVVTKPVPPDVIVGGVPAKVLRERDGES